jgi:putative addiction module component (TIGR02574 family)
MDSILLKQEALKLSPYERAQLVDALLESLDLAAQAEIDRAWLEESKDRVKAFQAGDIKAVDGETALTELREKLPQ